MVYSCMRTAIICVIFATLVAPASRVLAMEAPDWALTSSEQESVRLSAAVQQQPVILFFWATWCPYCKALMPHLQSIHEEYGDSIKILAINIRDDADPVAFMQRTGYDLTVLLDGDEVAELYEIWGTPGVIVVDGQRNIRFDLRDLPGRAMPKSVDTKKHSRKAAFIAPYWAAELRKGLDTILAEESE